jgi:MoaA/NifB/PqqE/SkfB family radical SAM enzyme
MIAHDDVKQLHLELSTYCNAACPNCPRNYYSAYTNPNLKLEHLSLDHVKSLNTLIPNLRLVNMCGNYGDPIMSPYIIDIINYITENNDKVEIHVHTNGGVRNHRFWKTLGEISSQNNQVVVVFSIDGLDDTNHIYRRNVVWKRLISNVIDYISSGGRAYWEFLKFEHNQHQVDRAREYALQLGFERFLPKKPLGHVNLGNGVGEIPVLDSESNIIYTIRESDKYKTIYTDIDPIAKIEKVSEKEYSKYYQAMNDSHKNKISTTQDFYNIDCITKQNSEIYISANGQVFPCCFLGHNNISGGKDTFDFHQWLNDNGYDEKLSLDSRSIKEILDDVIFSQIEEMWYTKNPAANRCINICGTKKNNRNTVYRIYND